MVAKAAFDDLVGFFVGPWQIQRHIHVLCACFYVEKLDART